MLDSVLGLTAAGDCISLLARIGFPPACFIARAETSFETDDLVEGTWLRAGVEGGSG
jgi:hypothetical protein